MAARLLPVGLGLLLFSLLILADATPPDPTWIGGLWDDGDGDDAIILVTTSPAPLPVPFVHCPDPHWTWVWLIPIGDEAMPPATTPRPHFSRGPPLS